MWTSDCFAAIKSRRNALRTLKRHPNEENFIAFKTARAKTTFTLKEGKRSWKGFASSITSKTCTQTA